LSHAFVVLAHDDPHSLNLLLRELIGHPVVLHVDRPAHRAGYATGICRLDNVLVNQNPHCVHWGGFSMTRAMLESVDLLLRWAPEAETITFLSGKCFPLRPVTEFINHIEHCGYAVHCRAARLAASRGVMSPTRVTRRHFLDGKVGHLKKQGAPRLGGVVRRIATGLTSAWPVTVPDVQHVVGSQWVTIPRGLAGELVEAYRSGSFDYLANAFAPDEVVVPTYVYNSSWAEQTRDGGLVREAAPTVATLSNHHWLRDDLNGNVGRAEVLEALQSDRFFVRKVALGSDPELLAAIRSRW
jgi:hypothetical protein